MTENKENWIFSNAGNESDRTILDYCFSEHFQTLLNIYESEYAKKKFKAASTKRLFVINKILKKNGVEKLISYDIFQRIHRNFVEVEGYEHTYREPSIKKKYLDMIVSVATGTKCSYKELYDSWFHLNVTKQNTISDPFRNSSWAMYFIKRSKKNENEKHMSLSRYELFINSEYEIRLAAEDNIYTGKNTSKKPFQFNLNWSKNIEGDIKPTVRNIFLQYHGGASPKYVEGYMISSITNGVMYSNAILLELIGKGDKITTDKIIPNFYYSDSYDQISEVIRDYFDIIPHNRSRTSSKPFTHIDDIKNELPLRNRITRPYKFDLMIASPVSYLSEEEYLKTSELTKALKDFLIRRKLFPKNRINTPATHYIDKMTKELKPHENFSNVKSRIDYKLHLQESLENFKASKYFILVLPRDVPSFSRIMSHWIFGNIENDFKNFVFIKNKDVELSTIVHENYKGKLKEISGLIIPTDFSKSVKDILNDIKAKISDIEVVLKN